ncbi:hypothetical protein [Photobacterium damselae]|uniref:hypothetical protein n=1 Tax=Photobacterium damselae TaxID=38293 RepID=UPI0040683176
MSLSIRAKNRNKKLANELITLHDWQQDRLFTGGLTRIKQLDKFIDHIMAKFPCCVNDGLEFGQWYDETDLFINDYVTLKANKYWDIADNHCPEFIRPDETDKDRIDLAVILPEPDIDQRNKGNMFRISHYGRNGAVSHQVYKSFREAMYECLLSGYNVYAPGTLDSLVGTREWERGLVVTKACMAGIWLVDYLKTVATAQERALFA